jgi:hypothetical protein
MLVNMVEKQWKRDNKKINCSTGFSQTGKIQLSYYQQGRGYWGLGDLSAQKGGFDSPKKDRIYYKRQDKRPYCIPNP